MRSIICLFAGLAVGCAAWPAAAQDQPILSAEAEFRRFARSAQAAFASGRYAEALQMSREAHAFASAELGPTHPLALRALNDMAVIHQLSGDNDAALPLALRAAGELERTAGPDHADTLNALANLAQLHVARSEPARAEPLLRRVHASRQRTMGADAEPTLNALLELAVFMKRAGRLRELAPQLAKAAETSLARYGADSALTRDLISASTAARAHPGNGESTGQ